MNEDKKSMKDKFRERYSKRYPDVNMDDEEAYYGQANQMMDEYEGYEESSRKMRESLANSPVFAEMLVAAKGQDDFDPVIWMVKSKGLDLEALSSDPEYEKNSPRRITTTWRNGRSRTRSRRRCKPICPPA